MGSLLLLSRYSRARGMAPLRLLTSASASASAVDSYRGRINPSINPSFNHRRKHFPENKKRGGGHDTRKPTFDTLTPPGYPGTARIQPPGTSGVRPNTLLSAFSGTVVPGIARTSAVSPRTANLF